MVYLISQSLIETRITKGITESFTKYQSFAVLLGLWGLVLNFLKVELFKIKRLRLELSQIQALNEPKKVKLKLNQL